MADAPGTYTTNDLSNAACFALLYTQALIGGPRSPAATSLAEATAELDRQRVAGAERRRLLAAGLAELRELGIIECERDGHGDLVPTVLHAERVTATGARLVTRDLS